MPPKKLIKKRFGRYLLLDHLVDGGMAQICRARFLGEQADKIVAVKMIQEKYSKDEAFKKMFMDEIKVTFGLIHPNIAQTYDYGIEKGQLYTAMEYVDGKNLKQYLDKLREKKFVFPLEITVYIIAQVAQALHYAHTFTDKLSGKMANIIHRDISPHNIMLTYDGSVKVIDFGIAKAEGNQDSTQAGTIKGKLSYLAPEYLEGLKLDPRYDEFSLGITLWEMLCNRKLFKSKNDLAVLKQIQDCQIPAPSSINPNVSKELDEIVLKSLQKDRDGRYENLDLMNRALVKFLYTNFPDFNATDLAHFAQELFKEDIQKDREQLFEFGKVDLKPFIEEMTKEGGPNSKEKISSKEPDAVSISASKSRIIDFEEDAKKISDLTLTKASQKPRPIPSGGAKSSTRITQIADKSSTRISRQDKSSLTSRELVIEQESTNFIPIIIIIVALIGVAFLGINHFRPDLIDKILKTDIKQVIGQPTKTDQVTPDQDATQKNSEIQNPIQNNAAIRIMNLDRRSQTVFIDGKIEKTSVLGEIKLASSGEVVLRVQEAGKKHYVKKINLNDSSETIKITIPDMEAASYGYLTTSTPCIVGKIFFELFGEQREEKLPIDGVGIPFPVLGSSTEYRVTYQKDGETIKRGAKFTIKQENDSVNFCEIIY